MNLDLASLVHVGSTGTDNSFSTSKIIKQTDKNEKCRVVAWTTLQLITCRSTLYHWYTSFDSFVDGFNSIRFIQRARSLALSFSLSFVFLWHLGIIISVYLTSLGNDVSSQGLLTSQYLHRFLDVVVIPCNLEPVIKLILRSGKVPSATGIISSHRVVEYLC
jgi:hypothetical protein